MKVYINGKYIPELDPEMCADYLMAVSDNPFRYVSPEGDTVVIDAPWEEAPEDTGEPLVFQFLAHARVVAMAIDLNWKWNGIFFESSSGDILEKVGGEWVLLLKEDIQK